MTAGLLAAAAARLAAAGVEAPRLDARLLLAAALGVDRAGLLAWSGPLPAGAEERFRGFIERRAAREPVSRILGRREFWSLSFALTPDTLDPRPDSEALVAAALARTPAGPFRVLDLGTGSGCLLLAVLSERPLASGLGTDIAAGAVAAARANAAALGLSARAAFAVADWDAGVSGRFELVIANPPYIAEGAVLAPELAHDPARALYAGADGLAAYRALAPVLARRVAPGGVAVVELGAGQAPAASQILAAAGPLTVEALVPDLAGIARAVVLRNCEKTLGDGGVPV
ncbi:MAG: peptide chain release factor N(5)-glutamine methyltransferase [Thalassobaculales bacterium]